MARPTSKTEVVSEGDARLTLVKGNKGLILKDGKTKASPETLRRVADELGLPKTGARGGKADVELLQVVRDAVTKLVNEAEDPNAIIGCSECGEVAVETIAYCPFCGFEGDIEPGPAKVADKPDSEAPWNESKDEETEGEEPEEEEAPKPSEQDDDEEESDDESEDDSEDESEEEGEDGTEEEPDDKGVGIATKGAAINKDVSAALQVQKDELDAALQRIVQLKRNAYTLSYDVGLVCREIRDKQLYKAAGFRSFSQFAQERLPMTRESALKLVAIVEKHSREEFDQIGYAKLRMLGSIDENLEFKDELLEKAKAGASTRELAQQIRGTATPDEVDEPKAKVSAPEKEKVDRITLIGKIGGRAQPAKFYDSDGESIVSVGAFAKDFNADAYSELEVSEGVFLRVGLRVVKNNVVGITVRFVRAEIEE